MAHSHKDRDRSRPTADLGIALGTMYFGTRVDERTAFEILDRFVEVGGRWIDTANNYAFWADPTGRGGSSEELIGRWLAARSGVREQLLISTKLGANPTVPHRWPESMEGLTTAAIEAALTGSLTRLGTDHVDLLWAHVEDRQAPLSEQVTALGRVVSSGRARRIGASNHASWRVAQARALAADWGVAPYSAIQLRHSFLQPMPGVPIPDSGGHIVATSESLDLAASEGLDLWAYSTLLSGAYVRADRPIPDAYLHASTTNRLWALESVAGKTGATPNQVVLAALMAGSPPVRPIVGVSSIRQLDEAASAHSLSFDSDDRVVLDLQL